MTPRTARLAALLAAGLASGVASGADASPPPRADALLHRRIPIPDSLLATDRGRAFGGDVRIGDLNGDGRCDFLVYRCADGPTGGPHAGGMKPCFLGAFEIDGTVLWSAGSGGRQPARPMSVAVADLTGDAAAEVVCFWHRPVPHAESDWRSLADVVVQIRDGRTGRVIREAAPPAVTRRRLSDPRAGANWVHQRLLIANFRGTDRPRDVVVKLGDALVALDEELNVLWTYRTRWTEYSRCPAYIPAIGDLDGDGRDEVNGGYFALGPTAPRCGRRGSAGTWIPSPSPGGIERGRSRGTANPGRTGGCGRFAPDSGTSSPRTVR